MCPVPPALPGGGVGLSPSWPGHHPSTAWDKVGDDRCPCPRQLKWVHTHSRSHLAGIPSLPAQGSASSPGSPGTRPGATSPGLLLLCGRSQGPAQLPPSGIMLSTLRAKGAGTSRAHSKALLWNGESLQLSTFWVYSGTPHEAQTPIMAFHGAKPNSWGGGRPGRRPHPGRSRARVHRADLHGVQLLQRQPPRVQECATTR